MSASAQPRSNPSTGELSIKKIILTIGLLLATVAIIFYITQPEIFSSIASKEVLYVTSRGGGLCNDACEPRKTYTIYENGVYEWHGRLTKDEIKQIKSFTHAFAQNPSPDKKFCQSYADGFDSVWIIPDTNAQIVPCEITDPSSEKIVERLESILYE